MKEIVIGTAAYVVATFAWAVLWHLVLFEALYIRMGYFGQEDPSLPLGFLAILVQGVLMNAAYTKLRTKSGGRFSPISFALICGLFLHSTHVIAYAAKHPIEPILFISMESFYLMIQFAVFAGVLGWLYRRQ